MKWKYYLATHSVIAFLAFVVCSLTYSVKYCGAQESSGDIETISQYSDDLLPGNVFLAGSHSAEDTALNEWVEREKRSATDGRSIKASINNIAPAEEASDDILASSSPSTNTTNVTSSTTASPDPVLPDKSSAEEEHNSSMSIFFVLCVLALGILLIHLMLQTHFQYLPESVVIVFLGALIGLIVNLISDQNIANWKKEEAFSPTAFFLVLLPPIIFESGYNLHKGNFFQVLMLVFLLKLLYYTDLISMSGFFLCFRILDLSLYLQLLEQPSLR